MTLKRLKKTPRDDAHPPWAIMDEFGHLADKKSNKFKRWKANAKFYKKKEVVNTLRELVEDENANWMARTGAVRSLAKLMKKDDFEKLAKKCAECNSFVAKELTKQLAKL